MNAVAVVFAFCFAGAFAADKKFRETDNNVRKYVLDCLATNRLDISVLGIDKIEDLRKESVNNLKDLDEDSRNCLVACIFQKQGLITSEGTVVEPVPRGDPRKKFTTTFEDAINACKGEKNLCKLGGCLFEIYS